MHQSLLLNSLGQNYGALVKREKAPKGMPPKNITPSTIFSHAEQLYQLPFLIFPLGYKIASWRCVKTWLSVAARYIFWDLMIEHFVKRRELWERKYLSKGTGVTSKLSTLSRLVVYLCPHWWFWLVHSMSEATERLSTGWREGRMGNFSYDEFCNLYCPERWVSWD